MSETSVKEEVLKLYLEKTQKINIFKVLGLEKGSENRHSNIVAWLLNPKESHNLGIQFLSKFLISISINAEKYNLENVSIKREDANDDGRPDIVIESDEFICIIEVKFGAKETNCQCKRYYNYYKGLQKDKYFVFLDIDDECYEKLKNQDGYKCDDNDEFDFSKTYRLATFKNNILFVIKELIANLDDTDINLIIVLNQYINFLEEKYFLLNENETRICIDILKTKDNLDKYMLAPMQDDILHKTLHEFIWYTAPNRYNDALANIISRKLYLKVIDKWKENGSFLSFRCAKCDNDDYHDKEHFYIDHRNNQITLNFQKNINQAEKQNIEIVKKDEYFENMLLSDIDFYKNLESKITEVMKNKLTV